MGTTRRGQTSASGESRRIGGGLGFYDRISRLERCQRRVYTDRYRVVSDQRSIIVTTPKADGLHTGKRWVRIPDGTKVKFREDGREGIIDGLTE
jgi:hypothetical protein